MSIEKIIEKINKDSEKEIQKIHKEAEQQADTLITTAKKEAEQQAQKLIILGKTQSENTKKIIISKTSQDAKRELLKIKEDIIEDCFTQALHRLAQIQGEPYNKFLRQQLKNSKTKLGENNTILISRDADKTIAEQEKIPIKGTITASGGVIIKSADGKITIDTTFDGIMKRKKAEIRVHIGKQLFS